jgi:hypothetical protein
VTRAHALEQFQKLALFVIGKIPDGNFVGLTHFFIELAKHFEAAGCDVAEHLSTIGRGALAASEFGLLELIEEAGDAGRRVNHAIANDERRQSFFTCAAQNAQHIVLLHCDTSARDNLCEMSLDQRGRAEDANGNFGFDRMKGTTLRDLNLETAAIRFADQVLVVVHLFSVMCCLGDVGDSRRLPAGTRDALALGYWIRRARKARPKPTRLPIAELLGRFGEQPERKPESLSLALTMKTLCAPTTLIATTW